MTIALEKPANSALREKAPVSTEASREVGGTALKAVATGTTALHQHEGVSNQELGTTMEKVTQIMYKMQDDPNFLGICEQRGVDPFDDMSTPGYWQLFNKFAGQRITAMRERGASGLMIDTLELAALTPSHIYNQTYLDSLQPLLKQGGFKTLNPEQKERHAASLRQASEFNGHVREFGIQWNPQAAGLHKSLGELIPMSVEKNGRVGAGRTLAACIRGAQHELGFAQILTAAGIANRPASTDEDIKGKDVIVTEPGYPALDIDVKASLTEIEAKGGANEAFAKDPRGTFKVYSLIKDSEFADGRFRLSDADAAQKATIIPGLLAKLRKA